MIFSIQVALMNGGKLLNITIRQWTSALFIIGTVLFSFGAYLSVSLNIHRLVNVTSVGSMSIMEIWLLFLVSVMLHRKRI